MMLHPLPWYLQLAAAAAHRAEIAAQARLPGTRDPSAAARCGNVWTMEYLCCEGISVLWHLIGLVPG